MAESWEQGREDVATSGGAPGADRQQFPSLIDDGVPPTP